MNYEKARKHANLLMKVVYNIDYHRCKIYESLLLQEFDNAAVISDIDKDYILRNSKVKKIFRSLAIWRMCLNMWKKQKGIISLLLVK